LLVLRGNPSLALRSADILNGLQRYTALRDVHVETSAGACQSCAALTRPATFSGHCRMCDFALMAHLPAASMKLLPDRPLVFRRGMALGGAVLLQADRVLEAVIGKFDGDSS
jgi:hypothetical protein